MSVKTVRESDMDEGGWNNAYGLGLTGSASRPVSPYSVGARACSASHNGGPVSPRSSTCWTGSEDRHEEVLREGSVYSKGFFASGTSSDLKSVLSDIKRNIATDFLIRAIFVIVQLQTQSSYP